MRVLLTNDDGINARGLEALRRIAGALSDDVWTVAPETDQSGQARSLTLSHPLRVREAGERSFAVTGTPTDCVIMGVRSLVPGPVDLVLSGVNQGTNIGDAVLYSGTVAGAMEGAFLGIPSVALSQAYAPDGTRAVRWETCEAAAPDILRALVADGFSASRLVNVNFPDCAPDELGPVEVVRQGQFEHALHVEERRDGRNLPYHWLQFRGGPTNEQPGTDIQALRGRRVAVTPLHPDLTDDRATGGLARLFSADA